MHREHLIILALLQICHFLADFTPLSTPWMIQAKSKGRPLLPILAHASVHAFLMFTVIHLCADFRAAIFLGAFQLITHFVIDVLKGLISNSFNPLKDASQSPFWTLFGLDQLLHQLVIVAMIAGLNYPF